MLEAVTFHVYLLQILLIIAVSISTGRSNTFANIASNGILSVMAGGTLLYDHRIVGYFLLAYGIFLMTLGVKEYEKKFGEIKIPKKATSKKPSYIT